RARPCSNRCVFRRRHGLSDDWEATAAEEVGTWNSFSADERERLGDIADWLLRHKHWEAARDFELDDEILTTIAIQAAMLVLALDVDYYREVSAIIVYPTTIISRGTYAGAVRG